MKHLGLQHRQCDDFNGIKLFSFCLASSQGQDCQIRAETPSLLQKTVVEKNA